MTPNDVTKRIEEKLDELRDEASFLSAMYAERNELYAVCAYLMHLLEKDTISMSMEEYDNVKYSSVFITPDYENKTLGIQIVKDTES
jgi:hypothetical protein